MRFSKKVFTFFVPHTNKTNSSKKTALTGDKSLIAYDIAHSWTGNLVTNATWDHVWLSLGWSTWFERKIMASIYGTDKYIDLDALGGYKLLCNTISDKFVSAELTKLVLDIGYSDPDYLQSIVPCEKGFHLLMALERAVGKHDFELFFQEYLRTFATKILTSDDFCDFFTSYFSGSENVIDFNWDMWFHEPGLPPEAQFDRSLSIEAENLANAWIRVDRNGDPPLPIDIRSWASNQQVCFLDTLQTLAGDQPLQLSTLNTLHRQYGFGANQNADVLLRYCQLALSAEDESMLLVVLQFATSQGRTDYTRPLYRAMFTSKKWRQLAKAAFLEHTDSYHPTCVKLITYDLLQIERSESAINSVLNWTKLSWEKALETVTSIPETELSWETSLVTATLVAAAVGLVLTRRRE